MLNYKCIESEMIWHFLLPVQNLEGPVVQNHLFKFGDEYQQNRNKEVNLWLLQKEETSPPSQGLKNSTLVDHYYNLFTSLKVWFLLVKLISWCYTHELCHDSILGRRGLSLYSTWNLNLLFSYLVWFFFLNYKNKILNTSCLATKLELLLEI